MLSNGRKPSILTASKYYFVSMITLAKKVDLVSWVKSYIKNRPRGDDILLKLRDGHRFYVRRVMDVWEIKEVVIDRQYEWVRRIRNGDVVIDVGAGIGDFDITADQAGAEVYAYDIDSERIRLLKRNICLNHTKKVRAGVKEVKSIDELMEENKLNRCDFLKIDCEGAEYPIFTKTTDKTFKKIGFMAMEAHLFTSKMQKSYDKLIRRFLKLGYEVKIFNNDVHANIRFVFCLKNEKLFFNEGVKNGATLTHGGIK